MASKRRQSIWDQLERIIAISSEQQIACLPISSAGEHIVASLAKDPVFARTTAEDIVTFATQNDIAASGILPKCQIDGLGRAIKIELKTVDRGGLVIAHLNQVLDARDQRAQVDGERLQTGTSWQRPYSGQLRCRG